MLQFKSKSKLFLRGASFLIFPSFWEKRKPYLYRFIPALTTSYWPFFLFLIFFPHRTLCGILLHIHFSYNFYRTSEKYALYSLEIEYFQHKAEQTLSPTYRLVQMDIWLILTTLKHLFWLCLLALCAWSYQQIMWRVTGVRREQRRQCRGREYRTSSAGERCTAVVSKRLRVVAVYKRGITRHTSGVAWERLSR